MEVIQKLPGGKFVCHMGLPHIPEHVYLGLPKKKFMTMYLWNSRVDILEDCETTNC